MLAFDGWADEKYNILGCEVYNLGTGKGTSVLEMVAAFEKASGKVLQAFAALFILFPTRFSIKKIFKW